MCVWRGRVGSPLVLQGVWDAAGRGRTPLLALRREGGLKANDGGARVGAVFLRSACMFREACLSPQQRVFSLSKPNVKRNSRPPCLPLPSSSMCVHGGERSRSPGETVPKKSRWPRVHQVKARASRSRGEGPPRRAGLKQDQDRSREGREHSRLQAMGCSWGTPAKGIPGDSQSRRGVRSGSSWGPLPGSASCTINGPPRAPQGVAATSIPPHAVAQSRRAAPPHMPHLAVHHQVRRPDLLWPPHHTQA